MMMNCDFRLKLRAARSLRRHFITKSHFLTFSETEVSCDVKKLKKENCRLKKIAKGARIFLQYNLDI